MKYCRLLTACLFLAAASPAAAGPFALSHQCPPSFEKRDGGCHLQSVYQRYASLNDAGVGGLRTGLPPFRDGFTAEQIDLGRYLFFDPALSATGKVSCATCHQPARGFADDRPGVGVGGRSERRKAPSLWNAGFLRRFFWDGRAHSLEEQLPGPLFDAGEMGNSPAHLLSTLNGLSAYRELFAAAFPDSAGGIRSDQVYRALAAFESSLISLNSRYDLYAHGITDALSSPEVEGLNVFRSFVARCAECHTPPLFTNQQIAVIGMPEPKGQPFDPGAGAITGEPALRGGFKVPSLRNVALTAPYGHAGQFATLRETVAFYTGGRGHAVSKSEALHIHWHIWEPKLSSAEIDRLVDFLATLTDESFRPTAPTAVPSGLVLPN
jgi:cytochrome c peroxidase